MSTVKRKSTQRSQPKGRTTRGSKNSTATPRRPARAKPSPGSGRAKATAAAPARKTTAKAKVAPRPAPRAVVPPVLSGRQLRDLRARAHELEPIVQVGHAGVSEAVVRAVNGALHDHELIKVRLHEPEDKQGMAEQLAGAARAALCGLIGHTLILYRPRPKTQPVSGVARTSIRRNQPKPRRSKSSRAR
jgi:RNA-binding protein